MIVRRADVDDVDGRIVDDGAPIRDGALVAVVARRPLGELEVDVGDRRKHRHGRLGTERALRRAVGHRVDFPHPAGADQADAQLPHSSLSPLVLSVARLTGGPNVGKESVCGTIGCIVAQMFILNKSRFAPSRCLAATLVARPAKQAARAAWESSEVTKEEVLSLIDLLERVRVPAERQFGLSEPDPLWNMTVYLMKRHLTGMLVTPTSLAHAADVPYTTALRRIDEMHGKGLLVYRPRTRSGRSFSIHPSPS